MRSHIIPPGADGMPLRHYIRRAYPMCDGALLKKALKNRDFRMDGARVGADEPLRAGAELKCFIADEYLFCAPLPVLARDEDIAVIVKPAGLSCQRDADDLGEDTVESRIAELFGPGARLVNRLDHYTGGVMPVALSDRAYEYMLCAFHDHTVEKIYVCEVTGAPKGGRLVNYARRARDGSGGVEVFDEPTVGAVRMALSYSVLRRGEVSRLRVALETGRTHQIRVQLAHAGLPVLGDDRYGDRDANSRFGVEHQRLWCQRIAFRDGLLQGRAYEADPPWL